MASPEPKESAPPPVPKARPDRAPRKCKCGHEVGHTMVSPSGEYTFGGWCLILLGISAKPTAIRFVCRQCDQVVWRSTDPKVIAETRLWG
jgi:hypothetical protein